MGKMSEKIWVNGKSFSHVNRSQQHRTERFVNKQEVSRCMLLFGIPMQRMLKLFRCWNVIGKGKCLKRMDSNAKRAISGTKKRAVHS